jgi:branched-chain amino acid transport system substrate-binding protein
MSTEAKEAKPSSGILPRLLAAFVIGLILGGIGIFAVQSSQYSAQLSALQNKVQSLQATVDALNTTKVYTIGVSFPLTGELSDVGNQWKTVAQMALNDLNSELANENVKVQFNLVVVDDKTQAQEALTAVQSLAQQGIKVVIGPAASSQVKAVKAYADANKILIVSPSSTSPTLAIPNDFIIRTVGSDAVQAEALAKLAFEQGARNVIVFYRDDEYGQAFAQFFSNVFTSLGGKATLTKYATGLADYASEVAQLSSQVKSIGADAVVMISFDTDGANILGHAKDDSTLSSVKWFSSEGVHGTTQLLSPEIATFIRKVNLLGTRPVFKENPVYKDFAARYKKLTGRDPPVFAANVYDSIILVGKAILLAGKYDGEAIRAAMFKVASNYYGASGWCILNDAGDRMYQDYAIWTVSSVNGTYEYQDVGSYSGGTITWG